jgi:hypothetical protein
MPEYANRTKIPAERTRHDIEALMKKCGADQFFSGDDGKRAVLAFRLSGRHIRFALGQRGESSSGSSAGRGLPDEHHEQTSSSTESVRR